VSPGHIREPFASRFACAGLGVATIEALDLVNGKGALPANGLLDRLPGDVSTFMKGVGTGQHTTQEEKTWQKSRHWTAKATWRSRT
jgi:hypothetical protein